MKRKKRWLLGLLGGWVGCVGMAIAASQFDRTQIDRTQIDRTQIDRTQIDRTQIDRTQIDRTQTSQMTADSDPADLAASGGLAVTPPAIAGLDLRRWPEECRELRRALSRELAQTTRRRRRGQNRMATPVNYAARPIQPLVAPAWKLRWQGTTLAIPAVDYRELTVLRSASGLLTIALRGDDSSEPAVRVLLSQRPAEAPLDNVRGAIASLDGVELLPLRGRRRLQTEDVLNQQLFSGSVSSEDLMELAYRHQPKQLSCEPEQWQTDLPVALALQTKLRREPLSDVVAVYPQVGHRQGRVVHRRGAAPGQARVTQAAQAAQAARAIQTTEWQAQIREPQVSSDILISLPDDHPSVSVGLALGQDNWWEAPDRPAWLDSLELAIAHPTPTHWQHLAQRLEASPLSDNSVKSVQQLAREQPDFDDAFSDTFSGTFSDALSDDLPDSRTDPATAD